MNNIVVTNLILSPIFLLLQLFDFYSTWRILRSGGREMNPIMAWIFKNIGVIKGLIITKTLMGMAFVYIIYLYKNTTEVTITLVIINLVYVFLVYLNNTKGLKKEGI